jgi:MFS family permease
VVIVGMFMSVLDVSIVNVAIPRMQKEFGTATENIQWITTAYTLCLGVIVPTSAWLGERLGLRRLYLLSLVAFAFASALCGMAWDLNSMIIFRVLQAVPGGVIPVTCLTILYRMVPRRELGTAMEPASRDRGPGGGQARRSGWSGSLEAVRGCADGAAGCRI